MGKRDWVIFWLSLVIVFMGLEILHAYRVTTLRGDTQRAVEVLDRRCIDRCKQVVASVGSGSRA